jgi:hypothetical protein
MTLALKRVNTTALPDRQNSRLDDEAFKGFCNFKIFMTIMIVFKSFFVLLPWVFESILPDRE